MVVVIDYGMGNLRSVAKALETVGAEVCVTSNPNEIKSADRIVLPGQGAFRDCISNLRSSRLLEALTEEVLIKGKPLLGICLGLQLMATISYENGEFDGLGWLDGVVCKLEKGLPVVRLPHIGWNETEFINNSLLARGLKSKPIFYYDHSYHFVPGDSKLTIATCTHGISFVAAVQHNNIVATQFHPEKSQEVGLKLLRNFLGWNP